MLEVKIVRLQGLQSGGLLGESDAFVVLKVSCGICTGYMHVIAGCCQPVMTESADQTYILTYLHPSPCM
jgi:hypothetical protein